jgi:hypothetical protein
MDDDLFGLLLAVGAFDDPEDARKATSEEHPADQPAPPVEQRRPIWTGDMTTAWKVVVIVAACLAGALLAYLLR